MSLGESLQSSSYLGDIGDAVGEELVYHGAGDVTVLKVVITAVMSIESYISHCDRKVIEIMRCCDESVETAISRLRWPSVAVKVLEEF